MPSSSAPQGDDTLAFEDQGRVECLRIMADMRFVGQAGTALQQLMMKLIPLRRSATPLQPQLPLFPFARERVLSHVNMLLRTGFSKAIACAACSTGPLSCVLRRVRVLPLTRPQVTPSSLRRPSSPASSSPLIAATHTRLTPSSPACTQAFAKTRRCSSWCSSAAKYHGALLLEV